MLTGGEDGFAHVVVKKGRCREADGGDVITIEDGVEAIGGCGDFMMAGNGLRGGKITMVHRRNLGAVVRLKAGNMYLLAEASSDDRHINQAHAVSTSKS